jgi:arabinogalactan endo-1,4-beta-galactosidase
VFRDVSDPSLPTVEPEPDSMDPLEVTGAPGQPVKLPQTAHVIFSDDHDEDLPIVWHEAAPVYAEEGTYTVNGRIDGITIKGGKATVGIEQQGNGDNWGSIDNVKSYRKL